MSLSIREAIRTMRQSGWTFEEIRQAVATVELDEQLDATQPMPPLRRPDADAALDLGDNEFGTD